MDDRLRSLVDAPLADPIKRFVPEGKRAVRRVARHREHDGIEAPKISRDDLAQRKSKAVADKLGKLFDYYASTELSVERIASHMGIYRQKQTGTDAKGKPVFERVLDVETVEAQIAWRRKSA